MDYSYLPNCMIRDVLEFWGDSRGCDIDPKDENEHIICISEGNGQAAADLAPIINKISGFFSIPAFNVYWYKKEISWKERLDNGEEIMHPHPLGSNMRIRSSIVEYRFASAYTLGEGVSELVGIDRLESFVSHEYGHLTDPKTKEMLLRISERQSVSCEDRRITEYRADIGECAFTGIEKTIDSLKLCEAQFANSKVDLARDVRTHPSYADRVRNVKALRETSSWAEFLEKSQSDSVINRVQAYAKLMEGVPYHLKENHFPTGQSK